MSMATVTDVRPTREMRPASSIRYGTSPPRAIAQASVGGSAAPSVVRRAAIASRTRAISTSLR